MDEAEGSSVDASGGQGLQVGEGNVQHNNFFGRKGSVKSQGVTAVVLVALLAGGAIWGYRDYQQHAQSTSGTTACQTAHQDYIQYLQENNDGEALNAIDAPFASEFSEQLSGAAGLTTASKLAADLRDESDALRNLANVETVEGPEPTGPDIQAATAAQVVVSAGERTLTTDCNTYGAFFP
jgi:hypothetical protein